MHRSPNTELSEQTEPDTITITVWDTGRYRKLRPAVEVTIRQMYSTGEYSQKALAEIFGVSAGLISKIVYYTRKGR